MHLDPRTIVFLNFVGAMLISIGMFNLSRNFFSQIKSIRQWSFATLFQAAGWILIALRDIIPDFFSIVLANTFLLSSLAIYFNILVAFKNLKIRNTWAFIPVILNLFVVCLFTFVIPDISVRIVSVSILSSCILFSSCILLLLYSTEKNYSHRFTGLLFGFCATILLARATTVIYYGPNDEEYLLKSSLLHDLLYMSYFISSILISFGFILMCTDLYLKNKKQFEQQLIISKDLLEETNQLGRIGNWEINLQNQNVYWSKVIREIHEVDDSFEPTLEEAIKFYRVGKDRDTISTVLNDAFLSPSSFDVKLQVTTAKGNIRWVRALGKSEFNGATCKRVFGIFQDITEEVRLKEEIIHVEAKYKEAFEHSAIGIAFVNKNHGFEVVNKELCDILGYSKDELLGFTFEDITHPDDLAQGLRQHQLLLDGKIQSFSMEKRYIHKNGNYVWTFMTVSSIRDSDNNIRQTIAHVKDISNLKNIEQSLRERESQLKEAQKLAKLGDYSYDFKTGVWSCSDVIDEITGLQPYETQDAENIAALFTPEFKEQLVDRIWETIRNFKEIRKAKHDYKIIRPSDEEVRWVTINGEIEYDTEGAPAKIIGTMQDITDRKIAEEKLEQSEAKYRQIVETAQEGIWLFDQDIQTIFINKKLCDMLGYTEEELLGTKGLDYTDEQGRERCHMAIYNIKRGCNEKFEILLKKKNGQWMWASIALGAILEKDNSFKGALAMVTDVTENHIANELLKQSEEKYKNLFNNNPMPIFIWDLADYRIIEVNKAAIHEYGYTKNEFQSKYITDIWIKQEQDQAIELSEKLKSSDSILISKIWKHTNKSASEMLMNISCIKIAYNNKPCVLAMAENVTEKLYVANRLQESYDKIRLLNDHLQKIREEERTNIAREIHDELGQQLTVLKMDLSYFGRLKYTQPVEQSEQIEQMIEKVDTAIQTVRKIATELRPGILDDLGIIAALDWQSNEFRHKTKIQCHFSCSLENDATISKEINTALFRIYQEALTNVARHAKASAVNAHLRKIDNILILEISDNGIGICQQEKQRKHSLGILGMKERAAMLGGELTINSRPMQGTSIIVSIPLI